MAKSIVYMAPPSSILDSRAEVLVCPTNSVGVMGAGLAKAFRNKFPGLLDAYRRHCNKHDYVDMVPFVFQTRGGQIVYCLHTKRHWRQDSKLAYVKKGLEGLAEWCKTARVESIAMPALGCGRGKLLWEDVLPSVMNFAESVTIPEIEIYFPY